MLENDYNGPAVLVDHEGNEHQVFAVLRVSTKLHRFGEQVIEGQTSWLGTLTGPVSLEEILGATSGNAPTPERARRLRHRRWRHRGPGLATVTGTGPAPFDTVTTTAAGPTTAAAPPAYGFSAVTSRPNTPRPPGWCTRSNAYRSAGSGSLRQRLHRDRTSGCTSRRFGRVRKSVSRYRALPSFVTSMAMPSGFEPGDERSDDRSPCRCRLASPSVASVGRHAQPRLVFRHVRLRTSPQPRRRRPCCRCRRHPPSGLTLGLHHAPALARSLHGFCSVALSVGAVDDLDALVHAPRHTRGQAHCTR